MISQNPLLRALAGLACALVSALAAENASTTAPGTIQGRVQNAVTGQYLHSARVSLKGTALVDLTDESGAFRLVDVPAGSAVLEVFYTGLDPVQVPVQVAPAGVVVQDVGLTNVARFGRAQDAVKLDAFVVSTARDTNAESIAINEQRFAPNLKNVVSTDAFGDVTDGNVGEFLKFLPGITTDTDVNEGGTVTTVSIRGFSSTMTRVSSDGAQLANTGSAQGNIRTFYFGQVSTNNLARVEVTKSPTPATPADTMAGSVNMISKSAFERKDARLNYSFSLAASSQNLTLQREPFVNDKLVYKIQPGFTFDYTLPVNRDFGIVVTGQNMDRYVDQAFNTLTYNTATAAGASLSNPFLQQIRFLEGPRISTRRSLGVKADWRVAPNSVLTLGLQSSSFLNKRSPVELVINAGTNAAPTVATGQRLTFGPDFTRGATGRGTMTMMGGADFEQPGRTRAANLRYRFDNGVWKIEAGADYSLSIGAVRDINANPGRFRGLGVSLAMPVRVEFSNPNVLGPQSIRLFDNTDREVDMNDIRNFRIGNVTNTNRDFSDEFESGKLDVRRRFKLFRFPFSVQAGGLTRTQTRDIHRYSGTWTYTGPADLSYLVHTRYKTQRDARYKSIPWPSVTKAWAAYQADRSIFTQTPAQVVSTESFTITNSEYIQERVDALYGQIEFQPLPKLTVLTGVRREATAINGLGPLVDPTAVWMRNADGSFARTPAGARIRKPEAGAVGSLQELALVRKERGAPADRNYEGYYPSAHVTYALGPNLLARASFAATYGRPDFTEIIPNTSVTELDTSNDPNLLDGRISVRNPGLKPWSAKNYDVSLEYYTPQGGLFSVGVFRKDIRDFFVDSTRIATAQDLQDLDLDAQYLGWEILTSTNGGNARTDGIEFNFQHSLQPLGAWGRPFQVFVNGSKLTLSGNQRASFGGFTPEMLNWGVNFNRQRVKAIARWNYRGERLQSVVAALGPNGAQYSAAITTLDLLLEYRVSPRLGVFANIQNIFNATNRIARYGDETPAYARHTQDTDNGTLLTFGVKGSF
jgi:iron complex outermembrane receptor protein